MALLDTTALVVSVIVTIAVHKIPVCVQAVQKENTICTVIRALPKTVKVKSVIETQENVVNVELYLWDKIRRNVELYLWEKIRRKKYF